MCMTYAPGGAKGLSKVRMLRKMQRPRLRSTCLTKTIVRFKGLIAKGVISKGLASPTIHAHLDTVRQYMHADIPGFPAASEVAPWPRL